MTNETLWWKTTEEDDEKADCLVKDILDLCEGKYNNVIFPAMLFALCHLTDQTDLDKEDLYKGLDTAFTAYEMMSKGRT